MKIIYVINDLQEAMRFDVSEEALERVDHLKKLIKNIDINENESMKIWSFSFIDKLSNHDFEGRGSVFVLRDKFGIRTAFEYPNWYGPEYVGFDLADLPDVFFHKRFLEHNFFTNNSLESYIAEEHKEEFYDQLKKCDTEINREIRDEFRKSLE